MLKIIFLKNIYFNIFLNKKNILKNNQYYILEHPLMALYSTSHMLCYKYNLLHMSDQNTAISLKGQQTKKFNLIFETINILHVIQIGNEMQRNEF
jgi:hypothetical protein